MINKEIENFQNDDSIKWYTLQVYNNSELSIEDKIIIKSEDMNFRDKIKAIVCPYEEVISISPKGKKTILKKAIYPGYVFIAIENLNTLVWSEIQKLPKVSKFVGEKNKPTVISKKDMTDILVKEKNRNKNELKYRINYLKGDKVRVIAGSFANFEGIVENFNPESQEITVLMKVLGRETPTNLSILDISKID